MHEQHQTTLRRTAKSWSGIRLSTRHMRPKHLNYKKWDPTENPHKRTANPCLKALPRSGKTTVGGMVLKARPSAHAAGRALATGPKAACRLIAAPNPLAQKGGALPCGVLLCRNHSSLPPSEVMLRRLAKHMALLLLLGGGVVFFCWL